MPSLEVRRSRDGHPPVTKWEREIHLNGTCGVIYLEPGARECGPGFFCIDGMAATQSHSYNISQCCGL